VLIYSKGAYIFAFNFHPAGSFERYFIPSPAGDYEVALSSDDTKYGGHGRTDNTVIYRAKKQKNGASGFFCYLPNRTAVVFLKIKRG
jgi:1,4-alpha-glucan branching enzyme